MNALIALHVPLDKRRLEPVVSRALTAALLALSLGAARPAAANVFEVGDGGTIRTRAASGDVVWVDTQDDAPDLVENGPEVPVQAVTLLDAPDAPAMFQAALAQAADQAKVSPSLLAALVWQESRWQPAALSPRGAVGLTQLMPATARGLAVDPRDVAANLRGGAMYLRRMLDTFDGNVESALAAYNAGPARVLRARGIPTITETRAYVSAIIDRLAPASAGTGLPILEGPTR